MHLVVLGTGIVGTCAGAWLQRDGHRPTFVSPVPPVPPVPPGEACSFGNAGSLSPSACLPVGRPGLRKALESPDVREFFGSQGFLVGGSAPERFRALVQAGGPKWERVIRAANMKVD